ncbi:hypothetical protein HDU98_011454, partial [Podochytrium sp. JEL0797]
MASSLAFTPTHPETSPLAPRQSGGIAARIAALNLQGEASQRSSVLAPLQPTPANQKTPLQPTNQSTPLQPTNQNTAPRSRKPPPPPPPKSKPTRNTFAPPSRNQSNSSLDSRRDEEDAQDDRSDISLDAAVPAARLRNPRRVVSSKTAKQDQLAPPTLPLRHSLSVVYPNGEFPPSLAELELMKQSQPDDPTPISTLTKRENILRELVDTERSYLSDMHVLKDVYITPAIENQLFPAADIKLIFGNVDALMECSESCLGVLEAGVAEDCVGAKFLELSPQIEEIYTAYCKNNETAMTKLFDYTTPSTSPAIQQFWKDAQSQLAGRTNAWDVSSLIIKPVQRVLKYPLLVSQLVKETPDTHDDHAALVKAFNELSRIAEEINEVKKRKDTVDKYVEGKGGLNMIHGVKKKFTRGVEELKHVTKLVDVTKDDQFEEIHEAFNRQHGKIISFTKDVK